MDKHASDERLVTEFARGERAALGELARRYEMALLGLAAGMLGGSRELACDAVQETWVRVIRFAANFDGRSSFKTWVYRIAINRCMDLRTVGRMERAGIGGGGVDGGTDGAVGGGTKSRGDGIDGRRGAGGGPEGAVAADEQRSAVRAAVGMLAAEKRDIVLLCYHAGMTHEEAAGILEVPVGTLKSRLHAALQELRGRLKEVDHD